MENKDHTVEQFDVKKTFSLYLWLLHVLFFLPFFAARCRYSYEQYLGWKKRNKKESMHAAPNLMPDQRISLFSSRIRDFGTCRLVGQLVRWLVGQLVGR